MGPRQPHSEQVHAEKYRDEGETFDQAMQRISTGLSDDATHHDEFLSILQDMRFMPAGRVQAAIGSRKNITPYNCFVSGTIHDSFVHGSGADDSIMDIAKQAATTMRMGGGIGYDFSTLRPSGALIQGVLSHTDGPMAFMPIYNAVCQATSSAGNRRGAQMGVLRVDHPDIEGFITAKQPTGEMEALWAHIEALEADNPARPTLVAALQKTLQLTGFNLSIAVTDKFMHHLETGRPFPLQFNGNIERHIDPQALWEKIMRSTWDWAEPGVLFIDTINKMNNLQYCETIAATNPCGEQPLPPYGACLLGSFNLAKYVRKLHQQFVLFDMTQLKADIPAVVRAMDNVVDYASYPLAQQEAEAKAKRRMGLGVTGLANAAEALGFPYGSPAFIQFERSVLLAINEGCYRAGAALAQEKGAFPLCDERLGDSQYLKATLPRDVLDEIEEHGLRNSHYTSIAPTGTISYCADNISSGLEPVFMYDGQRKMNTLDGAVVVDVQDYGVREFGVRGKTADRVTADEHVDVLTCAAGLVDSAVSKTCNVSPDMPWDDFKNIYVKAFERGAKGITTFNPGGKRLGIFIAKAKKEEAEAADSCTFDPETGRRSCE
jgi:ribonucleoside-diphosphate reductase alpha chain